MIIAGGNLKGDVTSCKIENQLVKTDLSSVFSIVKKDTFVSYDVCSKQVIEQYTIPSITEFGIIACFLGTFFGSIFLIFVGASLIDLINALIRKIK